MKKLFGHISLTHILIAAFALYAVWLWLMPNPELYLMRRYPTFFTDGLFLSNYLNFPGYPSEYIARFLTQLYKFPFLSSVIVAVILFAIYRLGMELFQGRIYRHMLPFISVVILMVMRNDYGHDFRFDLFLLIPVAALCLLVIALNRLSRIQFCMAYILLLGIVLYLGGLSVSVLFVIMAFMMLAERRKTVWMEWIVGTLIVFIVFRLLFAVSVHDLKQEAADMMRIYSFARLPFLLFGAVIVAGIIAIVGRKMHAGIILRPVRLRAGLLAIPAVFILLTCVFSRDDKEGLSVQHYALSCRWEETLEAAKRCKYPDRNTVFYTNEALYHTGKIHTDLFLYNQSFGSEGLILPEENTMAEILPNQHVFLYLGAISLSVKWGREAANVYGMNPYVMINLIKGYLAGGYLPEARKILNRLDHCLFEKTAVNYYRKLAEDTLLIRQDREIMEIKNAAVPVAIVARQNPIMNLPFLAQFPGVNRMAYDYLLLAALLDHQTDRFAYYVANLKDFGYGNIPKIYLEGLIYLSLYGKNPLDMDTYSFDMNTVQRFYNFQNELLAVASRNPSEASRILKDKYGDTYWYYILFQSRISDEEKKEAFFKITQ